MKPLEKILTPKTNWFLGLTIKRVDVIGRKYPKRENIKHLSTKKEKKKKEKTKNNNIRPNHTKAITYQIKQAFLRTTLNQNMRS